MESREIVALLREKRPKDHYELCEVLKSLFPLNKLITDHDRDVLDVALGEFIGNGVIPLNSSHPIAILFLGFWQRRVDGKILALFIDVFSYGTLPGMWNQVFDMETAKSNLSARGKGGMNANWEDALRVWPGNPNLN